MKDNINTPNHLLYEKDVFIYNSSSNKAEINNAKEQGKFLQKTSSQIVEKILKELLVLGLTKSELEIINSLFEGHTYFHLKNWIQTTKEKTFYYQIDKYVPEIIAILDLIKRDKIRIAVLNKLFQKIEEGRRSNDSLYNLTTYQVIDRLEKHFSNNQTQDKENSINPDFTLHRQSLAIYYLLTYSQMDISGINYTDVARFIQFLTGREANTEKIGNTRIYQTCKDLFNKREKRNIQDLTFIKHYFSKLGLNEIVKMIENDIENAKS